MRAVKIKQKERSLIACNSEHGMGEQPDSFQAVCQRCDIAHRRRQEQMETTCCLKRIYYV